MTKKQPESVVQKELIEVFGAREHNLKNIDATIPRNQLVVITGISGSGKSSLAFDTIYAEGQRRYMESFSAYARSFIGNMERPDVDKINGLSPVISIEQKTTSRNPRSTVGTVTEIYDFMRLLFAMIGEAYSYNTGRKMVKFSEEEITQNIFEHFENQKINILKKINFSNDFQNQFFNIYFKDEIVFESRYINQDSLNFNALINNSLTLDSFDDPTRIGHLKGYLLKLGLEKDFFAFFINGCPIDHMFIVDNGIVYAIFNPTSEGDYYKLEINEYFHKYYDKEFIYHKKPSSCKKYKKKYFFKVLKD